MKPIKKTKTQNNIRIIIVTETGSRFGIGHFMRCLSLFQAFKKFNMTPLLMISCQEKNIPFKLNKNVILLNWHEKNQYFLKLLKNADIIIIDSYKIKTEICKEISSFKRIVAYFDDFHRLRYPSGIVICGSIYGKKISCQKNCNVDYLRGPEYIVLRHSFWNVFKKYTRKKVRNILVTFGGYDKYSMTYKVLSYLNKFYPKIKKKIILGSYFNDFGRINSLQNKNVKIFTEPSANQIKKIMLDSDIAISAGGQTLNELARVGLPTIGICVAKNQMLNLTYWEKVGFLTYIGWYNSPNLFMKLDKAMKEIFNYRVRFQQSRIGRSLVDGNGALRIVRKLIAQARFSKPL